MCIPHASQRILNFDIAELLISLCLDLLQQFALRRQDLLESLLKCWLGGRRVAACLYYAEIVSSSTTEVENSIAYQMRKDEKLRAATTFLSNISCN